MYFSYYIPSLFIAGLPTHSSVPPCCSSFRGWENWGSLWAVLTPRCTQQASRGLQTNKMGTRSMVGTECHRVYIYAGYIHILYNVTVHELCSEPGFGLSSSGSPKRDSEDLIQSNRGKR